MRDGAPIADLPSLHYLAMELVTGDTLRALIDTRRLEVKHALDLMVQVAEALSAAHAAGVVHRDLKPENIMDARNGYAKVLDFGLAKLRPDMPAAEAGSKADTATSGLMLGTVGYMSPEQVQGRPADHRSDVFSFGCVVFEAVSATQAFSGTSAIDKLHRIANVDPATIVSRLTSASPELRLIIGKCLAKDPNDRYQSMRDAAIDLRGVMRSIESRPISTSTRGGRSMWWLGAAAAVIVIIAGVTVANWLGRRKSAAPTAPVSVRISPLTASGFVTHAALSPDGRYLAYTQNPGGRQTLWVRQLDGTTPLELIAPRNVGYWGLAFARDGASIFCTVKGADDPGGSIYQISFLGGPPRKLLTDVDSRPSISPDGKQIAWLRADFPERGSSALMIASVDGASPRALSVRRAPEFFAPGWFVNASWSPDGKRQDDDRDPWRPGQGRVSDHVSSIAA